MRRSWGPPEKDGVAFSRYVANWEAGEVLKDGYGKHLMKVLVLLPDRAAGRGLAEPRCYVSGFGGGATCAGRGGGLRSYRAPLNSKACPARPQVHVEGAGHERAHRELP